MHVSECSSTNDLARKLAHEDAPHGSWVSADVQLQGRGRLGREWISEKGNLYLSMVLKPEGSLSWAPIAIAVAISEVLKQRYEIETEIKWPNDILYEGRKLGGILCEGSSSGILTAGMGINVLKAPKTLRAISISEVVRINESEILKLRDDLVARVAKTTQTLDPEFVRKGYENRAAFRKNQNVQFTTNERQFEGKVVGLGDHGELRVMDAEGSELSIFASDVQAI